MLQAKGNLWEMDFECRCITTNGVVLKTGELVMGAGVAYQAKKRYPGIEGVLGSWVMAHGNWPCYIKEMGVISFPTKWHFKNPSDLFLIARSAKRLVDIANSNNIQSIGLTRPGCGMGKPIWSNVQNSIENILDDRFTVVSEE